MDPPGVGGEPPAPTVAIADLEKVVNYIRSVSAGILDDDPSGSPELDKALQHPANIEFIKKFISDSQTRSMVVYRNIPKEEEGDGEDASGSGQDVAAEYKVDLTVQFFSPKLVSVGFIKRGPVIEAEKKIGSQLRVLNLECSSPFETLHSYVSNAVAPFFKSYVKKSGKSDRYIIIIIILITLNLSLILIAIFIGSSNESVQLMPFMVHFCHSHSDLIMHLFFRQ